MERISNRWRDIGELIDLPFSKLDNMSKMYQRDSEECCRAVLSHWLDNPPPNYPITWKGLIDLLEDSQLGQVVSDLRNVLDKAVNLN